MTKSFSTLAKISALALSCSLAHTVNSHAQNVISGNSCTHRPSFPQKMGFAPAISALSTSEPRRLGLVLIGPDPTNPGVRKVHQHSSWTTGGALGSMIFDRAGDVFTYPAPHVNLIDNPPEKNNIIYKVDGSTGEMKVWKELPHSSVPTEENVFGLMGLTYSCFDNALYASTVVGSTRAKQNGKLYQIDLTTGEILSTLDDFDAFGLAVAEINGRKLLFAGSPRSSEILAVELSDKGGFNSRPLPYLSIANLGPRGDDHVRKITVNPSDGTLTATGVEFNFNLASTIQREENTYKLKLH